MTKQWGNFLAATCDACDLVSRTFGRDVKLVRDVMHDALRPRSRQELSRRSMGRDHLRGRGVGPRASAGLDQWLTDYGTNVPGFTLRIGAHRPRRHLAAFDARFLCGDAQWAIEHFLATPNAVRHALGRPEWMQRLAAQADRIRGFPSVRQKAMVATAARKLVAQELGLNWRTVDRRIKADPHFREPSVFAWAARYGVYALTRKYPPDPLKGERPLHPGTPAKTCDGTDGQPLR